MERTDRPDPADAAYRLALEAALAVDHIVPVSKGGTDD